MRALVAIATKSTSSVLETKGNERDTRRLHSMTFSLLSLAISWILNGPVSVCVVHYIHYMYMYMYTCKGKD